MAHNGTFKWDNLHFTANRIKQPILQTCWELKAKSRCSLKATQGYKKEVQTYLKHTHTHTHTHTHIHAYTHTYTHIHTHTHTHTGDKHHYLASFPYATLGTGCKTQFDWIAADGNAHRRVRVIGHHCGYDGSLDSIRGNHALVHWLAEYRRKVIHVLER